MLSERSERHQVHALRSQNGATARGRGAGSAVPALLPVIARLVNPLIRAFAGRRGVTFFAVVKHRGRRSGRWYATPVAARMTPDGFVVPMSFGPGADWYKNVLAAGGCTIRSNGVDYVEVQPEVIDRATARLAFGPVERTLLKFMGIEQFVRLQHRRAPDPPEDRERVPGPQELEHGRVI